VEWPRVSVSSSRSSLASHKDGALARLQNFHVPEGLARDTLERYAELARRAIASNNDSLGVQELRRQLTLKALEALD
jgi:hypothetical protein